MRRITPKELKHSFVITGRFLFLLLLFLFISLNIFYSQLVSPLYFSLLKEDKNSTVNFLSKIKFLPDFNNFLRINKNIYGAYLEDEVFAESFKRKQDIARYELLLQKNPSSRDLLYNLYLLYQSEGDTARAGEYLQKASKIDPSLTDRFSSAAK